MKTLIATAITALALCSASASATSLKNVPFEEQGMTTSMVSVPSNARCKINLPDEPTVLCQAPGEIKYHFTTMTLQGAVHPEQIANNLLQQLAQSEPGGRVLNRYTLPVVSQHKARQDAPLIFRQGQRVVTYAFDYENPQKNSRSVTALIIHSLPNNGAPITAITGYGVEVPRSGRLSLGQVKQELIRYATSYRYTPQYVQVANGQQVQFSSNLSARERDFAARQNRIHQDNMQALDDSYNSYMDRSAEQDRARRAYRAGNNDYDGHQALVDSIHERQQLIDPETGQRYEADGYRDYNYVNPHDSDMSVRTDDPLYDPNINTDQGSDYRRLEEIRY